MVNEQFPRELTNAHEADWVRRMADDYARMGVYRPEDLRRLLGDPTEGVLFDGNIIKRLARQ